MFGGTGGGKVELTVRPVTAGQVSLLGTTMGSPRDFAGLLAAVAHQIWTPVIDSVRPLAEVADGARPRGGRGALREAGALDRLTAAGPGPPG